jgi:putative transposase
MRKLVRLLADDEHARVLRSTVQRTNGGWVISFTVERSPKARRARCPLAAVGVDVGLARLATLSTGEVAANSRPLQAVLGKLRRLQRRLDRQRRAPRLIPARRRAGSRSPTRTDFRPLRSERGAVCRRLPDCDP